MYHRSQKWFVLLPFYDIEKNSSFFCSFLHRCTFLFVFVYAICTCKISTDELKRSVISCSKFCVFLDYFFIFCVNLCFYLDLMYFYMSACIRVRSIFSFVPLISGSWVQFAILITSRFQEHAQTFCCWYKHLNSGNDLYSWTCNNSHPSIPQFYCFRFLVEFVMFCLPFYDAAGIWAAQLCLWSVAINPEVLFK